MAWNKMSQRLLDKAILSLFVGMTFFSCAGTDSSVQKKAEENPYLFKAGTPVADSLASGMPEFARSVFKGVVDSVPGEYYYHATNGRIDSLFQKDGGQNKVIVSIAYDSPNVQNSYELKKGDRSYKVNEGILDVENEFPRYVKKYWSNGNPKAILTGILYRDDQGVTKVDSGHSETYFESGKINQQNDWKDKQGIASKKWNENGTLIGEIDFPKYFKEYWDNGNIKNIMTGLLYIDNQGNFALESGRSEIYFENGKIKEQNDWKDKQGFASKKWNENGLLVVELDFPKYIKKYWDNGNPQIVLTGLLYRNNQGNLGLINGREENYSEAGKLLEQTDWNNKQPIACKKWNENRMLTMDLDFQKTCIEYWDNGKIKQKGEGILYRMDGTKGCHVDSGHSEVFFENGKIKQQNEWKNKSLVKQKEWNENGGLLKEIDFPKYVKEYYDNGKIKKEMTGLYWSSPMNVEVENGSIKEYHENGRMKQHSIYKEKVPYSYKEWLENGTLTYEWNILTGDFKQYNENGTIHLEIKGFTGKKDKAIENGYLKMYYNNRKLQLQEHYKDNNAISKKFWYENGTVLLEGDVSKGFHKEYFENGKLSRDVSGKFHYEGKDLILENGSDKRWYENGTQKLENVFPKYVKLYSDKGILIKELEGTLYYDDQKKIQVQDGFEKYYYEDGQPKGLVNYKENRLISKTQWYTNGVVGISVELPNRYREFYDDGKIKAEVTGTIVEENGAFKIKDGIYKVYDPNGNVTNSATYNGFQVITEKK